MSNAKVATPPARKKPSNARAAHQHQNLSQSEMAAAAPPSSLQTDAVVVLEAGFGYRKEIFDNDDERHRYSCGFCSLILREPLQAECGHRFCQECQKAVLEATERGETIKCRICKEEGIKDEENKVDPKEMFPDRGFKKEMLKIRTKCPNEMCVWAGQFKDYVNHETECAHQPLVCDKCNSHVSKQKIDQHKARDCPKRDIKCKHCDADIVFDQEKVHLKDCTKVPESCGQCSRNIPRDKMRKHLSQDCPNRMVVCPLEGCAASPQPQSRFTQHIQKDQPKHLGWVLSHVADMEESLNTLLNAGFQKSPAASPTASGGAHSQGSSAPPLSEASLQDFHQKLEALERQVQEALRQGVATGGAGADRGNNSGQGQGRDQASGGAEAGAATSSSDQRVDAMELKVNTLEPILSVLHGEMNRCISAIEALETRVEREKRAADDWRQKMESYEQTINTMSSGLAQREERIRQLEAMGQDRCDGTLIWKIPNFSQVRTNALSGSVTNLHSRAFFSGPVGYKMCVRLYPNGDGMGKGSHLSLFFSIMRGPHDALLPWPFKQKVYFMLVDQTFKNHVVDAFRSEPSSTSFQRPTSEMNIATGCPMFVQLSKLSQPGYIKDDTMYIRVLVETDGLEEHLKQFDPRIMPLSGQ